MKYSPLEKSVAELWIKSGHPDPAVHGPALYELARALEDPFRQGVLVGDIATDIFNIVPQTNGVPPEFMLDLLNPGEEVEFVAFTNPGNGRIPERTIEADYVQVPTYMIANAIDWLLRHARDNQQYTLNRSMEVLKAGVVKKTNDDGWHTLIAAGVDRNIMVYDADATAGLFTKRLVSLMKVIFRRNGGGNSASINRRSLTDLYVSPEAVEDVRNWGLDQVDEITRREIYQASDGSASLTRVFGVNLHAIDELGEGQDYQAYLTSTLAGSLQASDVELVVGLNLQNSSFIMVEREPLQVFPDPQLHRQQRAGFYCWKEHGFGCLDGRDVLLGSF